MLPRDASILEHMEEYCEDIERYLHTAGDSFDAFLSDPMCQHSIAFCILQIGELVSKLSHELRSATIHDMNWTAIKGMRNIVVHDYGNVDLNIVFETLKYDIPELLERLTNNKK